MQRTWIVLGALAGLTTVLMAALAAHAQGRFDQTALVMVSRAIEIQGWHALALLACGLWTPRGGALANCAGGAFTAGVVLFCGSVYALALGGFRVAMLAPIGGTLLMAGWLLLGLSGLLAVRPAQGTATVTRHHDTSLRTTD